MIQLRKLNLGKSASERAAQFTPKIDVTADFFISHRPIRDVTSSSVVVVVVGPFRIRFRSIIHSPFASPSIHYRDWTRQTNVPRRADRRPSCLRKPSFPRYNVQDTDAVFERRGNESKWPAVTEEIVSPPSPYRGFESSCVPSRMISPQLSQVSDE